MQQFEFTKAQVDYLTTVPFFKASLYHIAPTAKQPFHRNGKRRTSDPSRLLHQNKHIHSKSTALPGVLDCDLLVNVF